MKKTVLSDDLSLESDHLAVLFDRKTGSMTALRNKLTGESYTVTHDEFEFFAVEFQLAQSQCIMQSCTTTEDRFTAEYRHDGMAITVSYRLFLHFIEKRIVVVGDRDFGLKKLTISSPEFSNTPFCLFLPYRYQGNVTFFGRTSAGGFFAGVEIPGDTSALEGNRITLAYRPGLKVKAGERLENEPAYFGVYKRKTEESDVSWEYLGGTAYLLPLQSESEAMLSMVATLLEPVRRAPSTILLLGACGYSWQYWYQSQNEVAARKKTVDFARECGMQYAQDAMPWGGNTAQISGVKELKDFTPHPWSLILPKHVRRKGMTPLIWSTMTNTHPWKNWDSGPFRKDRSEWFVQHPQPFQGMPFEGNCMGCQEYVDWLINYYLKWFEAGNFNGFSLDGDFYGGGGTGALSLLPLRCLAENHDHLPGEGQYAALRGMMRLLAAVREKYPMALFWLMRPVMDIGVWLMKNGGVMFPISEQPGVENVTGITDQPVNVTWGDTIRQWSRIRLHRHFLPHSFDQAKLFAAQAESDAVGLPWQSEKLDYALLSAIASTPNQCFFTGPVDLVPAADRKVIRQWLDWVRDNEKYLMARKDLPVWPKKDEVDGSVHIVANQGYIFLFNPNREKKKAGFDLTTESIGISAKGMYTVRRIHPAENSMLTALHGDTIKCELEGFSAAVLEIHKVSTRALTPYDKNRTIGRVKNIAGWETTGLLPTVSNISDAALPPESIDFSLLDLKSNGYAVVYELYQHKHGLIYVRGWMELPVGGNGMLWYVADGPVKVWVNGAEAGYNPDAVNPASPKDKYSTPCRWRKGRNEIVFALDTNHGKAGLVFAACEY